MDSSITRRRRWRRRLPVTGLFLLLAWLTGCAPGPQAAAEYPQDYAGDAAAQPAAAPAPPGQPLPAMPAQSLAGAGLTKAAVARAAAPRPPAASQAKEPAKEVSSKAQHPDQMLIFTSQLQMLVDKKSFAETIDQVADIAAGLGGYVAQQNNNAVTVRVPSGSFRDAMRKMEKLGEVIDRSVQAQDVTEEHHDLKIRLKSLHATRARLEAFLERAKNIQEVLEVEQQLTRLSGEIDKIEGRMRFLAARAAFSTITITLSPRPTKVVVVDRDKTPATPPKPRTLSLPIEWLSGIGIDELLKLKD